MIWMITGVGKKASVDCRDDMLNQMLLLLHPPAYSRVCQKSHRIWLSLWGDRHKHRGGVLRDSGRHHEGEGIFS